ncbi:MAG: DUF1824 family protein [Cyanosarcina radialis HA8281-LM2]|nr:DUF1824 family protein [Cyanosarcina radialis HA8281-LM2]
METTKQFKIPTKFLVSAVSLASALATAADPALADSYRFSPGSKCLSSDPTSDSTLVRGENYIYNTNTSKYAYVVCPIDVGVPDDKITNGVYTTVSVLKYNTQKLTCRISSYYGDGTFVDSKSASTSANGRASFNTPTVKSAIVYGVFCELPPSSGIYSLYTWFN